MTNQLNHRCQIMEVLHGSAPAPTKQTKRKWVSAIWIGLLTIAMAGLPAYSESDRGPLRSRAYRLRHIDSDAAKAHLERLDIGTDYNTLSSDVIIVTSDRTADLIKATSVISLADRERPVEIRPLLVPTEQIPAPRREELAVRLRSLSLGSLLNAPPTNAPNPAIVDLFEGTLIGIASAEILDQIEADIEAWKQEKSPAPPEAPNDIAPAEMPTEETKPSLADIAGRLFENDVKPQDPAAEPNAVEPTVEEADEPDAEMPDDPVEEAIDAAEPDTEPDATDDRPAEAIADFREQISQIPTDDSDEARQGMRAALEMLLRSGQEAEQDTAAHRPVEPEPAQIDPNEPLTADQIPDEALLVMDRHNRVVTQADLPPDKADEQLELTISLPEEVEIEALVELVGKQLGLNYMYDPAILRNQKVMLKINDGEIRMRDLYSLLESVLRFRGFVMTRRDRLVTIARQDQVTTLDPVLRLPDEPIQPGDVVVSSIFGLEHISADAAQRMLTQMKLGTEFVPIPETGTLVVTDYAFRMERIREVIAMIDVAGTPKDFQFRQIRYMEATELAPKVKALATEIQGVSITVAGCWPAAAQRTVTRTQIDPETRRPVRVQVPAPQAAQAAQPSADQMSVYLEPDERTNRVLMIGYAHELDVVNELIDSLDVPSFDLRFIKEYVIQYVEATEVVTVLNELGVARVTVAARQQQPATRQPAVRPGQQLTPQQQAALQQQQQQQQAARTGTAGINEPYISLRAATNSLLVNATEEQHKAIELTISHVDVMQRDQRTIREYEIQYVDTQSILETLTDLGIISPRTQAAGTAAAGAARTAAGTGAARAGQQQQQQQPAAATGEGVAPMTLPMADGTEREITAAEPQIAVLGATNSLLIHATPRQHAAIAMVIAHADRQRDRMFAPYVVYALENQDPVELAEILNRLIQETVDEAAAGARTEADARIQTRQTQVATLPSGEEQRIRIVPDPKTYSLIVYANQRNQQWVGDLIRELDEYRPQVLLDCTLVEITRDDAFQFDLDLIAKTYGGTNLRSGSIIGSRGDFTSDSFLDARSTSGVGKAFFSSDKVQALLDVVESRGYGRIMAKPKLLVNDNQEGEIKTENTISVAQVRTNVIPPTATTGSTTTTDVVFQDYVEGIILTIRPHISKGNMLRLEISMNRTDFSGLDRTVDITDGDAVRKVPVPPDRLSTDIFTTATVPDGSTIILGGLERVKQDKMHSKVPILGDLPLVGGLFRGINNRDIQSRLYVFVKASILRPGDQIEGLDDMRRVSERNRKQFEELERRFQEMQSWPGLRDTPLEPIRVLEED